MNQIINTRLKLHLTYSHVHPCNMLYKPATHCIYLHKDATLITNQCLNNEIPIGVVIDFIEDNDYVLEHDVNKEPINPSTRPQLIQELRDTYKDHYNRLYKEIHQEK